MSSSESSESVGGFSSSSSSSSYIENWSSSSDSSDSSSTENVWDFLGYLVVEINGSNSKDKFLPLYSHYNYISSDRDFWGCIYTDPKDLLGLQEYAYLSMVVNGETYWMKIYETSLPVACDCCSNLQGTVRLIPPVF